MVRGLVMRNGCTVRSIEGLGWSGIVDMGIGWEGEGKCGHCWGLEGGEMEEVSKGMLCGVVMVGNKEGGMGQEESGAQ